MLILRILKPAAVRSQISLVLISLLLKVFVGLAGAQTFTVLKNCNSTDGRHPQSGLTISGNTLYGTTYDGGNLNYGTLFKVNTDGTGYTVLMNFASTNGAHPIAILTVSGSTLYGTTAGVWNAGGGARFGTLFKMNTDGTDFKVLKNFTASSGGYPLGGLIFSGGELYGTTEYSGTSNCGTVFKVNTDLTGYTVLKNFTSSDGASPLAGLTVSNSTIYGTTWGGGSSNSGTVFKVNTDGTGFTLLKSFSFVEGAYPQSRVTLSGRTLYGTTRLGGSRGCGTVYKVNTDGTGFKVLKNFTSNDGIHPIAGLTVSGKTLYGTTVEGGSFGYGTVFKLNTDGTGFTVLKDFTSSDGACPESDLTMSGNTLYGTTFYGGNLDSGTVFRLSVGLDTATTAKGIFQSATNPEAASTGSFEQSVPSDTANLAVLHNDESLQGMHVFTCGHSFHMFVGPILSAIAQSAGITNHVQLGTSFIGGSRVIEHWEIPDGKNLAKRLLREGRVDVLTLAPFWLPDPGIEKFGALALENNPHIRVMVNEFWLPNDAYEPVYPALLLKKINHNAATIPELERQQELYDLEMRQYLAGLNSKLGKQIFFLVPVGEAVIALREKIIQHKAPGLLTQEDLFRDNWGHPQAPIRLLAGYCFYACIYQRSPVGLPAPEPGPYNAWPKIYQRPEGLPAPDVQEGKSLDPKLILLLQQLAWDAVTHHPMTGLTAEK